MSSMLSIIGQNTNQYIRLNKFWRQLGGKEEAKVSVKTKMLLKR